MPGKTTSARTREAKTRIVQPSMAGKVILLARKTLLSTICNAVKKAAPASPLIFGMSILGCLLGTYLSKPTDMEVLKSFYSNVRPWGFWTPVYKQLKAEDQSFQKNNDFYLDMMNCVIGIVWQSSMILLPIYFIIRDTSK